MTTRVWNGFIFVAISIFSILVYVAFIFCYDYLYMTWIYKTMAMVATAPVFYVCVLFTSLCVILLDETIHIARAIFWPTLAEVLALEMESSKKEVTPT